ncbi:hypothetical protein B0H13DRAFT_2099618 [Mycena leptocephala]|nr:hypothetical protein B0H13DRAFT_2099618 [Mycena leptocephala]
MVSEVGRCAGTVVYTIFSAGQGIIDLPHHIHGRRCPMAWAVCLDPRPRKTTRASSRVERRRRGWKRAKAAESTTGPSADVHVFCVGGDDVEEGGWRGGVCWRWRRRNARQCALSTRQFSAKARRLYGAERCCIRFRRHEREGGNEGEEEREGRCWVV